MRDATVIERGPAETVLFEPVHPWTRRLLAAEPAAWDHPWMRASPRAEQRPVLLRGEGLGTSYGDKQLFADLDVTVRAGERVAVTGPSGCGKTTLGDVLLGLRPERYATTPCTLALACRGRPQQRRSRNRHRAAPSPGPVTRAAPTPR